MCNPKNNPTEFDRAGQNPAPAEDSIDYENVSDVEVDDMDSIELQIIATQPIYSADGIILTLTED